MTNTVIYLHQEPWDRFNGNRHGISGGVFMLTVFFCVALLYVIVRMLIWGIKATWGIAKIITFVVLVPVLIIGLAVAGMFMLALLIVIVVSIIATIGGLMFS